MCLPTANGTFSLISIEILLCLLSDCRAPFEQKCAEPPAVSNVFSISMYALLRLKLFCTSKFV